MRRRGARPGWGTRSSWTALALLPWLPGCDWRAPADGPDELALEEVVAHLLERIELPAPTPDHAQPALGSLVPAVEGRRRELQEIGRRTALIVPAGREVSVEVELPRHAVLEFGVALDRATGANGSDGMRFEVLLDGRPVWDTALAPGPHGHGDAWLAVRVPLEGTDAPRRLTFRAEAGPAGDAEGDLGGFSNVVLKRRWTVPASRGGPDRPNLLLVLVDALRADALSEAEASAAGQSSTPHLDRLAAEGLVFARAYSTAPWTMPSVASLFTGKHVAEHGTVGSLQPRLLDEHDTLAERLARAGVATAAFVANPLISKELNFDQGFGELVLLRHARAEVLLAAARDWIVARDGRQWFAYVHAMEPHDPYTPPAELAAPVLAAYSGPLREATTAVLRDLKERCLAGEEEVATTDDVRYLRGLYDAEVAAFDAALGVFLAGLSERGALEHTLVVLTSDHGEEFYEHGSFLHGHELYEELVHVPLILWGPGLLEPGRTERPVSLVDLSDTLCSLLLPGGGAPTLLEVAAGRGEGAPLLLFSNRFDSSAHVNGLIGDRWKVLHRPDSGLHRLYDLERDPHERDDRLAGVDPGELPEADPRRVPVQSLERELAALAPPSRELLEVADPRAQEALRAMGYVE